MEESQSRSKSLCNGQTMVILIITGGPGSIPGGRYASYTISKR
jgi:hypothetical protein